MQNLQFLFLEPVLYASLKVVDDRGFQYYYTENILQMTVGLLFSTLNLPPGQYHWQFETMLLGGDFEEHRGKIQEN